MKIKYLFILIIGALFLFHSCNDDVDGELYTNFIGLKAPVDNEGVSNVYLRYKPEGKVSFKLPVIVGGTLVNGKDLNVKIETDNDTLAILNKEKYDIRTDLYYWQLPETFYEFPSPTCHIPAGSSLENFIIDFNFENLNLVENWVLPLTIVDDPSYKPNYRKGWRKALLHILPFNDYSGLYSSTGVNVYFDKETTNQLIVDSRFTKVVDENSIFFYAGVTQEKDRNRGVYKVIATFGEGTTDEKGITSGNLTLRAENEAIGFETIGQPTYEIREEMDVELPYLKHRYITLRMEYKYNDITKVPGRTLPYRAVGSMTHERKINILIPDEDQAIIW